MRPGVTACGHHSVDHNGEWVQWATMKSSLVGPHESSLHVRPVQRQEHNDDRRIYGLYEDEVKVLST